MSYGIEDTMAEAVGKEIRAVSLSADKELIAFAFADGSEIVLGVDGDCCSRSWIEHMEAPGDIAGATFLGFDPDKDEDMTNVTDDDAQNPVRKDAEEWEPQREHECLKVYQSKFRTSRGHVAVEFRNSSNGYYGGSLYVVSSNILRAASEGGGG